MKLLTLNLIAVGPFTDLALDFSAGEHGLHLVYGPNEAGKTSTLRALSHLLFNFPHVSADSFVHPYDQLRVGGTLRHSDGAQLEFVRRKGNRNTLRGPDDASVVPDEHLTRFLGGMNEDTFKTLFGIDHERLTRAGEEIRTGQGQLGELLFAAGAGLAGLRRAQETLQDGLDKLFKPRAQNPRINKGLTEYREAQEELKQHQLPSEEWQRHDRIHREALEESERIRGQIREARSEQVRLKRIKSGIPIVARRRRLIQAREELGDVIRLRDDFGAEFRKAQDQLRLAEQTIDQTRDVTSPRSTPSSPCSTRRGSCSTPPTRSARSGSGSARWRRHTRTASSAWRSSCVTPSTRRVACSATWVGLPIWMRPRRSGSEPMSR